MQIEIQDSAYKDLKKLEDYPHITNVKKLTNHYPPFRLRIGDYRVLFDIEDNRVIVSYIKHRKEAN